MTVTLKRELKRQIDVINQDIVDLVKQRTINDTDAVIDAQITILTKQRDNLLMLESICKARHRF